MKKMVCVVSNLFLAVLISSCGVEVNQSSLPEVKATEPVEVNRIEAKFVSDWCQRSKISFEADLTVSRIIKGVHATTCEEAAHTLSTLKTLDLSDFDSSEITDLRPVGVFTELTTLNLKGLGLKNIVRLEPLRNLYKLRVLDLSKNGFTSLVGLSSLVPSLEFLDVSHNPLVKPPTEGDSLRPEDHILDGPYELKTLVARHCGLTRFPALRKSVQVVDLRDNDIRFGESEYQLLYSLGIEVSERLADRGKSLKRIYLSSMHTDDKKRGEAALRTNNPGLEIDYDSVNTIVPESISAATSKSAE